MNISHTVWYRISGICLRKQKFYLIQDKPLPTLQDGFLRFEGKSCSQQNCCEECCISQYFPMMVRGVLL